MRGFFVCGPSNIRSEQHAVWQHAVRAARGPATRGPSSTRFEQRWKPGRAYPPRHGSFLRFWHTGRSRPDGQAALGRAVGGVLRCMPPAAVSGLCSFTAFQLENAVCLLFLRPSTGAPLLFFHSAEWFTFKNLAQRLKLYQKQTFY